MEYCICETNVIISLYLKVFLWIIIILSMLIGICAIDTEDEAIKILEMDIPNEESTTKEVRGTTFQIPEEKWTATALINIAYFLRNHKFNEWDRRYFQKKPDNVLIGYYKAFPKPSLRTLHWKVYENCYNNFYKCITYLHNVIETSPFTRADDVSIILNVKPSSLNGTSVKKLNNECKRILLNTENSGLPFDDPMEKFQWRTTASYYMCWYTMIGTPALSMLGESCDNFANCLDPIFGARNHDPRADNRLSFSCALYSFCPDPCCSAKYVTDLSQCHETENNPCFAENRHFSRKICSINRLENQNFNDIIANKWNVSCNCEMKGFTWKSQFQMCVDVNECLTGEHMCDRKTEDCFNLPGTYQCICKWGFAFDRGTRRCAKTGNVYASDYIEENYKDNLMDKFVSFVKYFGL